MTTSGLRANVKSSFVVCSVLVGVLFATLTSAHAVVPISPSWSPDIQMKAEHGDAEAQLELALMYLQGTGIKQNNAEAAHWLHKAAEQGKGQCLLGKLYSEGIVVRKNDVQAFKWFSNGECLKELARSYRYARGVNKDYAAAERLYSRLADQDSRLSDPDPQDYSEFARFYLDGDPPDFEKAYFWMSLATHRRHGGADDATRDDIEQHLTPGQIEAAQKTIWDRLPPSPGWLKIIAQNRAQALRGDAQSQASLARAYADGDDIHRDYVESYFWYSLAATDKGSRDFNVKHAQTYADAIAKHLTAKQVTSVKERITKWKPAIGN